MSWEDEKSDLITEVLAIIHNHTQLRNVVMNINTTKEYVPYQEYHQMISEIEDLR